MKIRPILAIGLFALAVTGPVAVAQSDTLGGVYTSAQAERGASIYAGSCASCHGADLVSSDAEAPSLSGFSFTLNWADKTLAAKLERIRTTMPLNKPGSLEDQAYLDVIAHILAVNGYPAGDTELTPDSDLAEIMVVRKP
jgi:mono/diheme cytochrome c family protein